MILYSGIVSRVWKITLLQFTSYSKFRLALLSRVNRYYFVPFFSLLENHGELFSFNLCSTELRLVLQKCVIPAR